MLMPSIPSPAALASAPPSSSTSLLSPPAITPAAQPSTEPTRAIVDLTTLLTISDFSTFYPGASPDSFRPIYYALADGSLIAPPFREDFTVNNVFLIITGCLLSIFLRNVCKAAIFLWRGKVKKKALLYTLFVSQLLGPIAIIPIIVAQFSRTASCAVILRFFFTASGVSLSLLITGIFGVKAWRCLDNSRLVSGVLVSLRVASSVVLILDVIRMPTHRSLSGRCRRPSTGLASIFLILLLTESLFICTCFLYAVQRSRGPVAVRGRISVHLSLDDVAYAQPAESRKESADSVQSRKGRFDVKLHTKHFSTSWRSSPSSREHSFAHMPHDRFQERHSRDSPGNMEAAQRLKHPIPFPSTIHPHPPASRSWTVKMPTTTDSSHLSESVAALPVHPPMSNFTRYVPRMSLFREVMRDELCYTAIATAFTAVSVAMILGVKNSGGIGSSVWVAFDWALISLLVVHSSGRAIRRHENESLLLHPSARYHDLHTDRTTAELLEDVPQPVRTPGVLSRARARRSITRHDIDGGVPPSELSTRRLFPGSAHSSRVDLHSLAASTSGASNLFPSVETESFSRTQVSSTVCMEDGPLRSPKSPEEWFSKNLLSAPPPPEPPDGRCCDASSADV